MKNFFLFILFFCIYSCSGLIYTGTMNRYYLKKEEFSWKGIQTPEFIFYYLPGSKAEKNISFVEKKIAEGIAKAKELTKINHIKTPIYYFIVDDRKEFSTLTKLNHSGISYSESNTIIESYFLLGEAHEVVHLITHQNWGSSHMWIMEGIAVYSDDEWNGKTLDKFCYNLYKKNELIPLKKFIKGSKFNQYDSQISYPQSGSLIKYIIHTYGWDKFLKFWKNPDIKKIYKISTDELENDWIEHLKNHNNYK